MWSWKSFFKVFCCVLKTHVPNAPCGVERGMVSRPYTICSLSFLMHRVELKVIYSNVFDCIFLKNVPNAPCGVERVVGRAHHWQGWAFLMHRVELKGRCNLWRNTNQTEKFLMHRVELKVSPLNLSTHLFDYFVPNAPCGVESKQFHYLPFFLRLCRFLMHRVELKDLNL